MQVLLYKQMWQYILRLHLFDSEFSLLGIILAVVFFQIKKNKGQHNVESAQASEVKPLRNWMWKGVFESMYQVLFQ